jgi:hypothetical protein
MFSGFSTNGESNILVQLGDTGGIENTGYLSKSTGTTASAGSTESATTGFILRTGGSTDTITGALKILNITGNSWVSEHTAAYGASASLFGGGSKTLSATLDRVRITTVNGTDTFDAGSINILYE